METSGMAKERKKCVEILQCSLLSLSVMLGRDKSSNGTGMRGEGDEWGISWWDSFTQNGFNRRSTLIKVRFTRVGRPQELDFYVENLGERKML